MKKNVAIIQEISLLYELSLSVGQSQDLKENARRFLQTLISRKNLTYASIWLKRNASGRQDPENCLEILVGLPASRIAQTNLRTDHPICKRLQQESIINRVAGDPGFEELIHEKNVEKGAYAIFRLGDIGMLKLYDQKKKEKFSQIELNQLKQVIKKLTISFNGNISQLRFQEELKQKSHYAEALVENEKKIRMIINSALDAVITIDKKSNITEWNHQAEDMFGWTKEEVLGKPLKDFIIPPALRDQHTAGMQHYYATGHGPVLNNRVEVPAMDRNGREFPVELSVVPMKIKGEHAFSAFVRDITQQKEAEKKREMLLKKLEKANHELQDFAYIVSHDLKAPLRAIGSLAHWLEEDYGEKIDQDGLDQLAMLQGRVKRMHELINGILNYSRVGRTNTETEEVALEGVVAKTIELLSPPSHIQIQVEGQWPSLILNRVRIQQVFQNLIGNAIKYMDKANGWVEVAVEETETNWTFSIKDNGPGIEGKYFEKIFRIFQTLNPRDEVEGTGIGLSIVKKILDLYGGTIWLTSEKSQGTTFYFTLPKTLNEASRNET